MGHEPAFTVEGVIKNPTCLTVELAHNQNDIGSQIERGA